MTFNTGDIVQIKRPMRLEIEHGTIVRQLASSCGDAYTIDSRGIRYLIPVEWVSPVDCYGWYSV